VVLSLSESHNKANVGKSVDESLEEIKRIRHTFPELKIMQDIATTFSCPFEGRMEIPPLVELIGKLSDIGIGEFTLCDTIGTAYPKQVEEVFDTVRTAFPDAVFNVHIHDTRNMGMLNSYVAIKHGARGVQSSLGGLGGCPFAPGASGNTATEDLVYMLHAEGFDTGVNFDLLLDAARFLRKHVAGNYSGHQVMIEK
jgi:hydroxymethylglutaryl-CoA lyase